MIALSTEIRKIVGKKNDDLRKEGFLPAVLYGPKQESMPLKVNSKKFEQAHQEAGESSMISLEIQGESKKHLVLIHSIQKHPLTDNIIHIDFYKPCLTDEIEATVPLIFEGEAPAVKELGGTIVKHFHEIVVKAFPQDLPNEIKVDIMCLKTFEDQISIKDINLILGEKVKAVRELDDIVASASPPEKVEEELEKPIEETKEAEKVEEKEKQEKEEEQEQEKQEQGEQEKVKEEKNK